MQCYVIEHIAAKLQDRSFESALHPHVHKRIIRHRHGLNVVMGVGPRFIPLLIFRDLPWGAKRGQHVRFVCHTNLERPDDITVKIPAKAACGTADLDTQQHPQQEGPHGHQVKRICALTINSKV